MSTSAALQSSASSAIFNSFWLKDSSREFERRLVPTNPPVRVKIGHFIRTANHFPCSLMVSKSPLDVPSKLLSVA
ncbi:hypothetical protein PF005_g11526 [Phytophthora fragariae]|uniref:Uncharacterized protein n=1 Tax=Phytophthora fragariae TaxID=53985 RepID=A0A6A3KTE9_9STRA|nr:hypothetical protein PF009_g10223 [Phytophthora fragariae]KAE9008728.1 hypothetical protein PF011_g10592 [Phytophthora fragariae]KAE9111034.1 hypothetical protein PF007_g11625 [Phytophthora fragariae]KAE9210217.1 hypothetical protein PF005_g11526 [Phytophthora fragariae]KAE9229194.1 hypothetical protein PF004_g10848 [Phytophthora fragariae]